MAAEAGMAGNTGALKRAIGLAGLTSIGVGATIGTGIFFILSQAVPLAGPSVIWSFLIAAVVAGATALCYAELASAVPASGSSYSFAYATMGEGVAVLVGSCLILEWGVATSAVAVGWSQYVNKLLSSTFGFELPYALSNAPEEGGVVNLPAILLIALCGLLLMRGASETAKTNAIMVMIKVLVLLIFVVVAARGFTAENLQPFAPHGIAGISTAAGVIFFSFVGLDGVATAGEEAKNPRRNLPMAILLSLVIVTAIYIAVAVVAVGAQEQGKFEGQEAGLAQILQDVTGSTWPATILAIGAVTSIFSVTLVGIFGQTRILFAMSRDGMLPPLFHKVNPRRLTPVRNTVVVSILLAVLAGLVPINFLAELTSVGTLVAFVTVSVSLIILRRRAPEMPRGFRVPLYPLIPLAAIAGSLWIISNLRPITLYVFLAWAAVAFLWYLLYSRKRSRLAEPSDSTLEREAGA
ncbi:amino acid permease [Saccharopolyspora sp. NPDC002376]